MIELGGIASAPGYPQLAVEAALRHHTAEIVVAHNHPSGLAQPPDEEITVIRTLVSLFDTLGRPVVDHLTVADTHTFGMAEAGLLRVIAEAPT